jgi:lysophospholipase L1-like esterase
MSNQSMMDRDIAFQRYVAVGDSFTEGLNDELGADGRHRGWADRFAANLDAIHPGLLYANLAVRGKLIGEVVDEQVPEAIDLKPDLVTFAAGVNDALRRNFDLDASTEQLAQGIGALRQTGATVVVFAFGDPSRRSRVMGTVSERLREYNAATRRVAEHSGAVVVDFWGAAVFDDDEFWSTDRLHLSPAGHALAARAALSALGLDDETWRTPRASVRPPTPLVRATGNVKWAGGHFLPWIGRRLRGVSSGDGVTAKRPILEPVEAADW